MSTRRHSALAILIFVLAAVSMQRHAVAHMSTVIAGNIIGDPTQYMWSMWWWPHAIFAGVNPFVTHEIWYPAAYNLGSVTSTPVPSIVFAPLNAILGWRDGPVVSYNLANLAAPVISAWFTYRLVLHLTRRPWPAILAGWLYGFSVYGLSQLQGHMNLVFTFLPVVLVLLTVQRLDGTIGRTRYVLLAALALVVQIGIGTEIVFTTTLLGVLALLLALGFAPTDMRAQLLRTVVPELAGAYLIAAIVCSPYLYYQFTGPTVEQDFNSANKVADLLSFLVPTPIVRLGGNAFLPVSTNFPSVAGFLETGTYLGLPLVVGAVGGVIGGWRRWPMKVLLLVAGVAAIWALGPVVDIAGHGTVPLPWRWLEHRKLFDEVTPVRIGMYVELAAAIAIGLWIAAPTPDRRYARAWRWLVALLAVASIYPNVDGTDISGPIFRESVASPAFISHGLYRREIPRRTVVLPIPFGPFGNSLLWQAQARGYFRLASGWFGYYPPSYGNSAFAGQLLGFHVFTDPRALGRAFLAAHDVGAIVIVDGQGGPWPRFFAQLGLHGVQTGGVELFRVPAR